MKPLRWVGTTELNIHFWFGCLFPDRAGSISTLDSLDFARYSDDGNRESDERVAGKENPAVISEYNMNNYTVNTQT